MGSLVDVVRPVPEELARIVGFRGHLGTRLDAAMDQLADDAAAAVDALYSTVADVADDVVEEDPAGSGEDAVAR